MFRTVLRPRSWLWAWGDDPPPAFLFPPTNHTFHYLQATFPKPNRDPGCFRWQQSTALMATYVSLASKGNANRNLVPGRSRSTETYHCHNSRFQSRGRSGCSRGCSVCSTLLHHPPSLTLEFQIHSITGSPTIVSRAKSWMISNSNPALPPRPTRCRYSPRRTPAISVISHRFDAGPQTKDRNARLAADPYRLTCI